MDELAPVLHAFYTQPLNPQQRQVIHNRLISSLHDHTLLPQAATYISNVASNYHPATQQTNLPPLDPYLTHHALHLIDTHVAQPNFITFPDTLRNNLLTCLNSFLTSAYHPPNPTNLNSNSLPTHLLSKAASVSAHLTIRQHLLTSNSTFPNQLLSAAGTQAAHAPSTLASALAAVAILSAIIEYLASSSATFRAAERINITNILRPHVPDILSALELATRAAGPSLSSASPTLASAAVNAVAILPVALAPHPGAAAEHAVALLLRAVDRRRDPLGAKMLAALSDLFTGRLRADWTTVSSQVAVLLEDVAMGAHVSPVYAARLVPVADSLIRRLLPGTLAPSQNLHRLLNGLMGLAVRWSTSKPARLPSVLDAWINILDAADDAEVSDDFWQTVYNAVSKLCVEQAFYVTNANVLRAMQTTDGDYERNDSDQSNLFVWDDEAEILAEVAANPVGLSAVLFVERDDDLDETIDIAGFVDDDDNGNEKTGNQLPSFIDYNRKAFVRKCVETLTAVVRMSPQTVGAHAAEFSCQTLKQKAQAVVNAAGTNGIANLNKNCTEDLYDLHTAATMVQTIVPYIDFASPVAQELLATLCNLIVDLGIWRLDSSLGVILLRTTTILVRILSQASPDVINKIGISLLHTSREIQRFETANPLLASAATVLLVALDEVCRRELFSNSPPIEVELITNTKSRTITQLGVASMVRWAIVPPRDPKKLVPIKWSIEEWQARQAACEKLCQEIFSKFEEYCTLQDQRVLSNGAVEILAKGAGMLRAMIMVTYSIQGNTKDAIWTSGVKRLSRKLVSVLSNIRNLLVPDGQNMMKLDEDVKRLICGVMGSMVGTIGAVLQTCRHQIDREDAKLASDTVEVVLPVAQLSGSIRLARAALKLVRDQLADGSTALIAPGIELSWQVLDRGGDQDVAAAAISVLTEALKRHWQEFWPGDVAQAVVDANIGKKMASEQMQQIYAKALQGILKGITSSDLSVCRASLLSLQTLDASRKLYSRKQAFRNSGASDMIVMECMKILGAGGDSGRTSLGDEAVEVIWGIAKVDLRDFCERCLFQVMSQFGGLKEGQAVELAKGFSGTQERSGFVTAARAYANDSVYFMKLNAGPSL